MLHLWQTSLGLAGGPRFRREFMRLPDLKRIEHHGIRSAEKILEDVLQPSCHCFAKEQKPV